MAREWESTLPVANRPTAGLGGLRLILIGEGTATTHELPSSGRLAIGRSEEAAICIHDPAISRRHALLHLGDTLSVEDLGSANGTYVRGSQIEARKAIEVALGDSIEVGTTLIIVQGWKSAHTRGSEITLSPGERPMEALQRLIDRVAPSNLSVLLLGETGVGKGYIAGELHRRSRRAHRPFLQLNCAALPTGLLESELFGYERGAFTGATHAKKGLLETAQGGTVLLDEVGELPMSMQVKMLRALDEREVLPLGALKHRSIDVRFISATNRDLDADVAKRTFREDLFFRLNGISLEIPPLRRRISEIPALAQRFVTEACEKAGLERKQLCAESLARLKSHRWAGNVRELKNAMERAVALCAGQVISPCDMPLDKLSSQDLRAEAKLAGAAKPAERQKIINALEQCGGNQSRAAETLGMSRGTLISRLAEYDIPRPRKNRRM